MPVGHVYTKPSLFDWCCTPRSSRHPALILPRPNHRKEATLRTERVDRPTRRLEADDSVDVTILWEINEELQKDKLRTMPAFRADKQISFFWRTSILSGAESKWDDRNCVLGGKSKMRWSSSQNYIQDQRSMQQVNRMFLAVGLPRCFNKKLYFGKYVKS